MFKTHNSETCLPPLIISFSVPTKKEASNTEWRFNTQRQPQIFWGTFQTFHPFIPKTLTHWNPWWTTPPADWIQMVSKPHFIRNIRGHMAGSTDGYILIDVCGHVQKKYIYIYNYLNLRGKMIFCYNLPLKNQTCIAAVFCSMGLFKDGALSKSPYQVWAANLDHLTSFSFKLWHQKGDIWW